MMFFFSDWAWQNTGHAVLLLFPVYSLVNSRQIVCNVTGMQMSRVPLCCLWFSLFGVNRAAGTPVAEVSVALGIFGVTLVWYMWWCWCTVGQICDYLGIRCFTIDVKAKVKN